MVKRELEAYYDRHPERAGDKRSEDANAASYAGLVNLFALLDDYHVISKAHGTLQDLKPEPPDVNLQL